MPGPALLRRCAVLAARDRFYRRIDLVDEGERPGALHDNRVPGAQLLGWVVFRHDPAGPSDDGAQRQWRTVHEVQRPGSRQG